MEKTEKRTAEEILAHTLSVKVETILLNPEATLTNSEAIEFAKIYAAHELSCFKIRLKEAIINNGDFRPYTITELIDQL